MFQHVPASNKIAVIVRVALRVETLNKLDSILHRNVLFLLNVGRIKAHSTVVPKFAEQ
jgi:hypothetical protein